MNLQSGQDKLHYIERQLVKEQVHVAFLQVKGSGGVIKSRAFLRYASESAGVWGCAVWIARTLPLATRKGQKLMISDTDVFVEEAGPRWLIVKIRTPASWLYLASLHRPSQTRPSEERRAFDDFMVQIFERVQGCPCIFGVDANARVPPSHGAVTGELQCGEDDHAGGEFVAVLAASGLWLPTTFALCHSGPHHTWTHPNGKRSRIDFICLSGHFLHENVRTWVATEIDLLNVNDDHDAVAGRLTLTQACNERQPPMMDRVRQYDQRALKRPEVIRDMEMWMDLFGLSRLPWDWM